MLFPRSAFLALALQLPSAHAARKDYSKKSKLSVNSTSQNVCGNQWGNVVCSGQFGSEDCYSCGERIEWLVANRGVSQEIAGQRVADEFLVDCGQCGQLGGDTDLDNEGYGLVWSDEFDGSGAVDGSKWTHVVAGNGFGNNELQYYTDRTDNSWLSGGSLFIRARLENYGGKEYTSAKLESTAHWTYGKVSVRTRLFGTARGTWAAHWMMPRDSAYGIWPKSGEIDIMEHVGYDTGKFHGTVHTGAYYHSIGTQVGGSIDVSATDWHVWTMEWRPEIILFACDEQVYRVFRKEGSDTDVWPFNQRFYAILNFAVGGDWGGQQGIDSAAFAGDGQIYEVDWIRVEQKGAPQQPTPGPQPSPGPQPTPGSCVDENVNCAAWAAMGECEANPGYMLVSCRESCGACPTTPAPTPAPTQAPTPPCSDGNQMCADWAAMGECEANPGWMLVNCRQSCGECSAPTTTPAPTGPCEVWCADDYYGGENVGRHCAPGDMAHLCGGCSFCR